MLTSIAGRSVIVTGASKGIGKGIAKVFCRNGAKVFIVARNLANAEACADELRRDGGIATGYAADVTSIDDMQRLAECTASAHDGIDILCANAGIFPQARIEELSPEDWDRVFATNLKGAFLAVKACLPYLKKSDQARVVLTSSITGPITGFPGWSHYGATKAGQLGFMRTACIELAKYGITMNAVLPGNILTEAWRRWDLTTNVPWPHPSHSRSSARSKISATRHCSSLRKRRRTSPDRRSSLMAARFFPRA
jgi:3-oxoacyl-[acyl-carrier protein] reductase